MLQARQGVFWLWRESKVKSGVKRSRIVAAGVHHRNHRLREIKAKVEDYQVCCTKRMLHATLQGEQESNICRVKNIKRIVWHREQSNERSHVPGQRRI